MRQLVVMTLKTTRPTILLSSCANFPKLSAFYSLKMLKKRQPLHEELVQLSENQLRTWMISEEVRSVGTLCLMGSCNCPKGFSIPNSRQ